MNQISLQFKNNQFAYSISGPNVFQYENDNFVVLQFGKKKLKESVIIESFFENISGINEDFVLACYDKRNKVIKIITDYFASVPIFYGKVGSDFFVDTDINNLKLKFEELTFNKQYFNNYLSLDNFVYADPSITTFEEINRVLPASIISWDITQKILKEVGYWKIKPNEIKFNTDNELYSRFKELFKKSVLGKIPDNTLNVASELSGGLDSTSIVAVLRQDGQKKVKTLFANLTNEDYFVNLVNERFGCEGQKVFHPKGKDLYKNIEKITKISGQPDPFMFPGITYPQYFDIMEADGANVIFSGTGGDELVGFGIEYLDELLSKRKFKELRYLLEVYKRNFRLGNTRNIEKFEVTYFFRKFNKHSKFLSNLNLILFYVSNYPIDFLLFIPLAGILKIVNKFVVKKVGLPIGLIKDLDVISKINVYDNFDKNYLNDNQQKHLKSIFNFNYLKQNEVFSSFLSRKDSFYARPFMEKDLVELSIAVDLKTKFGIGKTRSLLRESLKCYLPSEIYNRYSKGFANEAAEEIVLEMIPEFEKRHYLEIWNFIDKLKFQELVSIVKNKKINFKEKRIHIWLTTKIICFAIWLDLNKNDIKYE